MINYKNFKGIDFESHKMQGSADIADMEIPCCFAINGLIYPTYFGTFFHATERLFRNIEALLEVMPDFQPDMVGITEAFMSLLFKNSTLTEDVCMEEYNTRFLINFEGIASFVVQINEVNNVKVDGKTIKGGFSLTVITMAENKGILPDGKLDCMSSYKGQKIYDVYASGTYTVREKA